MAKKDNKDNGTQVQEGLGFDLDAWKNMGLEQIKVLNSQIEEKESSKRKIDEEISALVANRTVVEKALGIHKSRSTGSTRMKIKPILVQVFAENEGTTLDFDAIVEKVQAEQPKANEKKIRGAFERWVKSDNRVSLTEGGWVFKNAE